MAEETEWLTEGHGGGGGIWDQGRMWLGHSSI